MYDFKSRVRYSEVNSERQLTAPALIDYLQNCRTFQSEDMNIGVEYLEQHHVVGVIVLGDRHEPLSKACGAYYGEHLAI